MTRKDNVVVGIRLTPEAKNKLEEEARRNYRPLSDQLRMIVDAWLSDNQCNSCKKSGFPRSG